MRHDVDRLDYQILAIVDKFDGDVVPTAAIHRGTDRSQRTVERHITRMVLPNWCDRSPWLKRETGGVSITDDGYAALDGLRTNPYLQAGHTQREWIDRVRNPWREGDSKIQNAAIPSSKRPPRDGSSGLWFWCDRCGRKAWHDEGGCRCGWEDEWYTKKHYEGTLAWRRPSLDDV